MKKALSQASMTEDESQEVRETMKQGVLNIQPLSVLVAKKTLEQSIPYAAVTSVPPSEPKRKYKRVKHQATRLGKI